MLFCVSKQIALPVKYTNIIAHSESKIKFTGIGYFTGTLYGFENGSEIPVYHELYPDALRQVSKGVSGCIYVVDASEDQFVPFRNIPCARLGTVPLDVADHIDVPDAFELLQSYIRNGKLKVSRYEDKTPDQLEWWYSAVADYMSEKNMIETPDCSYARFVKNKLPRAWEIYLSKCGE